MHVKTIVLINLLFLAGCNGPVKTDSVATGNRDLWQVYENSLKKAKYVDLTHTITPTISVWKGFGPAKFGQTVDPATGKPYTYIQAFRTGIGL